MQLHEPPVWRRYVLCLVRRRRPCHVCEDYVGIPRPSTPARPFAIPGPTRPAGHRSKHGRGAICCHGRSPSARALVCAAAPCRPCGGGHGARHRRSAARVQENERCAKVCEELSPDQVLNPRDSSFFDVTTLACSEAITRLLGKEST